MSSNETAATVEATTRIITTNEYACSAAMRPVEILCLSVSGFIAGACGSNKNGAADVRSLRSLGKVSAAWLALALRAACI
ncbi:MAG: hypothetical protein AMJ55_07490 [Gammaproteobacteria bacterium SG8_15]|nr:MAG: hypothetical protein AMJ55_07490 [Gammaproteobacteria bacterium SG8_15]